MLKVKTEFQGNTTIPIYEKKNGVVVEKRIELTAETSQEDLALLHAFPICRSFLEVVPETVNLEKNGKK